MILPVILSGGSGTRLWPISRKLFPKQFIDLISDNSLFQDTVLRISKDTLNPIIVCNEEHRFIVAEQPDVHVPIATCCDGFFVTHTKDTVNLPSDKLTLTPYDPYRNPQPVMDMETAPIRMMRDPFVMKSNYISFF